jgi:hypothetical protein
METLFALIGLGTVAYFVWSWVQLVWFRSKTLAVLKSEIDYEPAVPGFQAPVFHEVTRVAKDSGGNEYDAAVLFMLPQLRLLQESGDPSCATFIDEKLARMRGLRSRCGGVADMLDEVIRETAREADASRTAATLGQTPLHASVPVLPGAGGPRATSAKRGRDDLLKALADTIRSGSAASDPGDVAKSAGAADRRGSSQRDGERHAAGSGRRDGAAAGKSRPSMHEAAVSLLSVQLELARSENPLKELMNDKWALGYAFGMLDSALQSQGQAADAEGLALMAVSCHKLMGSMDAGVAMFRRSMSLQSDGDFDEGRTVGGQEFCDWLNRSNPTPMGLAAHLHPSVSGNARGASHP